MERRKKTCECAALRHFCFYLYLSLIAAAVVAMLTPLPLLRHLFPVFSCVDTSIRTTKVRETNFEISCIPSKSNLIQRSRWGAGGQGVCAVCVSGADVCDVRAFGRFVPNCCLTCIFCEKMANGSRRCAANDFISPELAPSRVCIVCVQESPRNHVPMKRIHFLPKAKRYTGRRVWLGRKILQRGYVGHSHLS